MRIDRPVAPLKPEQFIYWVHSLLAFYLSDPAHRQPGNGLKEWLQEADKTMVTKTKGPEKERRQFVTDMLLSLEEVYGQQYVYRQIEGLDVKLTFLPRKSNEDQQLLNAVTLQRLKEGLSQENTNIIRSQQLAESRPKVLRRLNFKQDSDDSSCISSSDEEDGETCVVD